jgi:hypothetical protein
MDIGTAVATFATGAAGTLSMMKLLQMMERRRQKPEEPKKEHLWPNGERDQIIGAIDELKSENRQRRREHKELATAVEDIAGRLERAGIL